LKKTARKRLCPQRRYDGGRLKGKEEKPAGGRVPSERRLLPRGEEIPHPTPAPPHTPPPPTTQKKPHPPPTPPPPPRPPPHPPPPPPPKNPPHKHPPKRDKNANHEMDEIRNSDYARTSELKKGK